MPNHVTHKIIFDIRAADEVFSAVCPGGKFDFNKLIPQPPQLYHGNLSSNDEQDFKCNWYTWNTENWGTKWNAYSQSCKIVGNTAFIKFDTAWSVPYPIISAFANRFQIPFEHRYFDEGHNFWGIETWGNSKDSDGIHRVKKQRDNPGDKKTLCIELKGYDPDEPEEGE